MDQLFIDFEWTFGQERHSDRDSFEKAVYAFNEEDKHTAGLAAALAHVLPQMTSSVARSAGSFA